VGSHRARYIFLSSSFPRDVSLLLFRVGCKIQVEQDTPYNDSLQFTYLLTSPSGQATGCRDVSVTLQFHRRWLGAAHFVAGITNMDPVPRRWITAVRSSGIIQSHRGAGEGKQSKASFFPPPACVSYIVRFRFWEAPALFNAPAWRECVWCVWHRHALPSRQTFWRGGGSGCVLRPRLAFGSSPRADVRTWYYPVWVGSMIWYMH